jgi:sugar phosphate isomerase/epimerase
MSDSAKNLATGLASVTFRQFGPREIVELSRRAGLMGIEWGGDVHVPPGDLARARDVGRMTRDAGLSAVAYGSYLRLGEPDQASFESIVETTRELGAPAVRVWAGTRGSAAADEGYRRRVIDDALRLADLAAAAGVVVCYEYHVDTLTDTDASAAALFRATEHPAIRTLWQPPHEMDVEQRCASLRGVLGKLQHVHVFHWPRRGERAPLADGAAGWIRYLEILREHDRPCPLLLEFVRGDDPDQLIADATTLREWIAQV